MTKYFLFFIFICFAHAESPHENVKQLNLYKLSDIEKAYETLKDDTSEYNKEFKEYITFMLVLGYQFNKDEVKYKELGKQAYAFENKDKVFIHPAYNKDETQLKKNFSVLLERASIYSVKKEMTSKGMVLYKWKWMTEVEKAVSIQQEQEYERKLKALQKIKELEKKRQETSKHDKEMYERMKKDIESNKSKDSKMMGKVCYMCHGERYIGKIKSNNGQYIKIKCNLCKGRGFID